MMMAPKVFMAIAAEESYLVCLLLPCCFQLGPIGGPPAVFRFWRVPFVPHGGQFLHLKVSVFVCDKNVDTRKVVKIGFAFRVAIKMTIQLQLCIFMHMFVYYWKMRQSGGKRAKTAFITPSSVESQHCQSGKIWIIVLWPGLELPLFLSLSSSFPQKSCNRRNDSRHDKRNSGQ